MEIIKAKNIVKSFGGKAVSKLSTDEGKIRGRKTVRSFEEKTVLKGVSFSLEEGNVLAVIGPSGSGKSTLLRCLCNLEKIDSGEIEICGDVIASTVDGRAVYAPQEVLHRMSKDVGMVFQSFHLFPHFSVMRNITEALISVDKKSKEEAEEIAAGLLKKLGLSGKENDYPCNLSGGQAQRVSIARALARSPKVLLFDEPTSALDPELTGEVLRVIKSLAAEKMTMVVVTHEIQFAAEVASRAIFIGDGEIIADGTAEEVLIHPEHERLKSFINGLQHI